MQNKKILMILQDDCTEVIGGITTATNNLVNFLIEKNFKIITCCFCAISNKKPIGLNKNADFYNLNKKDKKDIALKKLINEINPDLIIFIYPSFFIEANLKEEFSNIPKLILFHSRPDFYFETNCDVEKLKKLAKYNTYFQILLPSFKNLIPEELKDIKTICIPNIVKQQKISLNKGQEHNKIVYLSRIDTLKGQDFLIKSFGKIAKKYPNWQIDIWGHCSVKNYLEKLNKLIKKLKLEKQIFFKGITKNSIETLKNYDFCVFPSYFEGWGFGLTEALSVGLPAIGLKGCSAVNELIIENYNGFLTPKNPTEFSKKIEFLIKDKVTRFKMKENAIKSIEKYNENLVNNLWLKYILKIINDENIETFKIDAPTKEIFPIEDLTKDFKENKNNFFQKIFSIRNEFIKRKKKKILTLFGFKIILKEI